MADETGFEQGMLWPVPKFHFSVTIGDKLTDASFKEVSGLDMEVNLIEYRHSNAKGAPYFTKIKMPGLAVFPNVILRKGVFKDDNEFFKWFSELKMNTITRVPVTIKLLDEEGNPVMAWDLINAFPVKITGTTLDSEDDGEPAIEELEIAHEGLIIRNPA
jgi:phage tail-like protein